jgi:hypothetical protein
MFGNAISSFRTWTQPAAYTDRSVAQRSYQIHAKHMHGLVGPVHPTNETVQFKFKRLTQSSSCSRPSKWRAVWNTHMLTRLATSATATLFWNSEHERVSISRPWRHRYCSTLQRRADLCQIKPWRWQQYIPPKRWYLPAGPHGVTTQKINSDVKFTLNMSEPVADCKAKRLSRVHLCCHQTKGRHYVGRTDKPFESKIKV